jgi:branched-subunit amino acid ABC-type transport system permease component
VLEPSFLIGQVLSGLTAAMFLFIVASGLSVVFGVLRVLNFAHGSFYMLGAYLSWQLTQWLGAKDAASRAIGGAGGTITHHHAIGRDHRPYLEAEIGALGIAVLRAVKDTLDPRGIMNPGVLVPPAAEPASEKAE